LNQLVLGLGTNLGDRLNYLRLAIAEIKKIPNCIIQQISPIYTSNALTPDNSPNNWDLPYLNLAVLCHTNLSAEDILFHTQNIEIKLGRIKNEKWSPRIIDIDLLIYENLIINKENLQIPHPHLLERPFALWPLADLLPNYIHPVLQKNLYELSEKFGSRFSSNTLFNTKQIPHRINSPRLMGIVNLTPDSFSDGGKFQTIDAALLHIKDLISQGAEIIDLGAEATNPNVEAISANKEWLRLQDILTALVSQKKSFVIPPIISIDTRHAEVAKKALGIGADWINDVSGLNQPEMKEVIAASKCPVIIMHNLGIPVDKKICLPNNIDPVENILTWAKQKINELIEYGIQKEKIIFDPGVGFGKNAQQSLRIIKQIKQFNQLEVPILVGHSRKRFLELFTDQPFEKRDLITALISTQFLRDVDYLRVHNIEMHATSFKFI